MLRTRDLKDLCELSWPLLGPDVVASGVSVVGATTREPPPSTSALLRVGSVRIGDAIMLLRVISAHMQRSKNKQKFVA